MYVCIYLSIYLSRSLADRWGTTVDFTTSFLQSSLFSAFLSSIFHQGLEQNGCWDIKRRYKQSIPGTHPPQTHVVCILRRSWRRRPQPSRRSCHCLHRSGIVPVVRVRAIVILAVFVVVVVISAVIQHHRRRCHHNHLFPSSSPSSPL